MEHRPTVRKLIPAKRVNSFDKAVAIKAPKKKKGKEKKKKTVEREVEEFLSNPVAEELKIKPNTYYWANFWGNEEIVLTNDNGKFFYTHGNDMAFHTESIKFLKEVENYKK